MTRQSKRTAHTDVPRMIAAVKPNSQLELLLDSLLLGFGECNVTLSTLNGDTYKLNVIFDGGSNPLHALPTTEQ